MSESTKVKVRCYCHGFGDCFLITMIDDQQTQFKMVIDCGLLSGSKRINQVIEDIASETNNELDALAITHEHKDHLSGFTSGKVLWQQMSVKEIWLAWTEDPNDPQAILLQNESRNLAMHVENARSFAGAAASDRVSKLLEFSKNTAESLEIAKSLSQKHQYFEPGTVHMVPNTTVEMFVLGPPRDTTLLRRNTISEAHSFQLYGFNVKKEETLAAHAKAATPAVGYEQTMRQYMGLNHFGIEAPFSSRHCEKVTDSGVIQDKLRDVNSSWRMIGNGSDSEIEHLALQYDKFINNTSLVLAFRIGSKVLLFPGDAQGGNWKSWENYPDTIDIKKLLAQTAFYKVGHHGSHNATYFTDRADLFRSDVVSFMPFEKASVYPSIPDDRVEQHFRSTNRLAVAEESAAAPSPFEPATKLLPDGRPLYVDVTIVI